MTHSELLLGLRELGEEKGSRVRRTTSSFLGEIAGTREAN